jgi:hypothetical protein
MLTLDWQFGGFDFQFLLLSGNSEHKHCPLLVFGNHYQGSFYA